MVQNPSELSCRGPRALSQEIRLADDEEVPPVFDGKTVVSAPPDGPTNAARARCHGLGALESGGAVPGLCAGFPVIERGNFLIVEAAQGR
jgi:hypothetical protein